MRSESSTSSATGSGTEWRPGLSALYVDAFLGYFGFYLLIPPLAVALTGRLHWPAWQAGLLLALRPLVQQGLAPWLGRWADRMGYRPAVVLGLLIRAIGFAAFALVHSVPGLVLAILLASVGGALFDPADVGALVALVPETERARIFSRRLAFGNAGVVLGPVVGSILSGRSFALDAWTAGLLYLAAAVFTVISYPRSLNLASDRERQRVLPAERRQPWLSQLTLLFSGYYFLSAQFYILVPLVLGVQERRGILVGVVLSAYACLVVLFQGVTTARCGHWPAKWRLILGVALAASAMAVGALGTWLWAVFLLVAGLFALASMLALPAMFEVTLGHARPREWAARYGFSTLSLGIGGAAGNGLGGGLVTLAEALHVPGLPWLAAGVVGGVVTAALAALPLPSRPDASGQSDRRDS